MHPAWGRDNAAVKRLMINGIGMSVPGGRTRGASRTASHGGICNIANTHLQPKALPVAA